MIILRTLNHSLKGHYKALLLHGVGFALLFQVFMMLALIVRFQAFPNYVTFYDWIGNAQWILQSTPSLRDALGIIWEEWLIEIGKMNYDYGTGISEWSLNIVPSRLLVLGLLGAMTSWCLVLMRQDTHTQGTSATLHATTGLGTLLVAITNATMSWVVCCATPSWVVGLAMLGLGVSTSLALETMGPLLSGLGFGLLFTMIIVLAWRKSRAFASPKGKPLHA
ncbi:hypothetical protein NBRC116594_33030 [Shimia sp. NS0008-38b]|uniref:hypothetical protein n=1 Tax=Shimia sp. NS0008-38b TaxID=3127653 RepID=UPI00310A3CB8